MNFLLSWREKALEAGRDLGLLGLRIWIAQEFIQSGLVKVSGRWMAPEWFVQLDFPGVVSWLGPDLNWIVAGWGELVLGVTVLLGLFSRASAVGLLFITWVAVYTVHFDLGWAGWNLIETEGGQGFKVPLMLGLMLLAIVTQGPGRYAVDGWPALVRRFQTAAVN